MTLASGGNFYVTGNITGATLNAFFDTATATTETTRARVEAMNGDVQRAISIDWDEVSQARPEWNARWSRWIER